MTTALARLGTRSALVGGVEAVPVLSVRVRCDGLCEVCTPNAQPSRVHTCRSSGRPSK